MNGPVASWTPAAETNKEDVSPRQDSCSTIVDSVQDSSGESGSACLWGREGESSEPGCFYGQQASAYRCNVCNIFTTCQELLNGHLQGKKHMKRMAALQAKDDQTSQTEALSGKPSKSASETAFHCEVCNVYATSQEQLTMHREGRRHQRLAAFEEEAAEKQPTPKLPSLAVDAHWQDRLVHKQLNGDRTTSGVSKVQQGDTERPLQQLPAGPLSHDTSKLEAPAAQDPGHAAYFGGLVMGMPKYLCQACGIATTSQANLEDHKRGRRHLRRVAHLMRRLGITAEEAEQLGEHAVQQLGYQVAEASGGPDTPLLTSGPSVVPTIEMFRQGSIQTGYESHTLSQLQRQASGSLFESFSALKRQASGNFYEGFSCVRVGSIVLPSSMDLRNFLDEVQFDGSRFLVQTAEDLEGQPQPVGEPEKSATKGGQLDTGLEPVQETEAPSQGPPSPVPTQPTGDPEGREQGLRAAKIAAFFCDICGVAATSAAHLAAHYRGRKHIRRLAALESGEAAGPKGPLYCALCCLTCRSPEHLQLHMCGRTHLRRVRIAELQAQQPTAYQPQWALGTSAAAESASAQSPASSPHTPPLAHGSQRVAAAQECSPSSTADNSPSQRGGPGTPPPQPRPNSAILQKTPSPPPEFCTPRTQVTSSDGRAPMGGSFSGGGNVGLNSAACDGQAFSPEGLRAHYSSAQHRQRRKPQYRPEASPDRNGSAQHYSGNRYSSYNDQRPTQHAPRAPAGMSPRQVTLQHQLQGVIAAAPQPLQMAVPMAPMPGLAPLSGMPGVHPYVGWLPVGQGSMAHYVQAAWWPSTQPAFGIDAKPGMASNRHPHAQALIPPGIAYPLPLQDMDFTGGGAALASHQAADQHLQHMAWPCMESQQEVDFNQPRQAKQYHRRQNEPSPGLPFGRRPPAVEERRADQN